jgi:uncharacterized protein Smg (DUF494 family)
VRTADVVLILANLVIAKKKKAHRKKRYTLKLALRVYHEKEKKSRVGEKIMGDVLFMLIWGIYGMLTPKSEKQRLMNEEATEWYYEQEEM